MLSKVITTAAQYESHKMHFTHNSPLEIFLLFLFGALSAIACKILGFCSFLSSEKVADLWSFRCIVQMQIYGCFCTINRFGFILRVLLEKTELLQFTVNIFIMEISKLLYCRCYERFPFCPANQKFLLISGTVELNTQTLSLCLDCTMFVLMYQKTGLLIDS